MKKDFKSAADVFFTPQEPPAREMPDLPEFQVPAGYRLVKESKNKRLQLLITPTIQADLKTAAMLEGISVNELCNRIFEEYLRKGE